MSWRDELRPASFRGVPFKVNSADSQHGRRQAIHEYAKRDTPRAEDLGRKAREFSVEGIVIGKEYFGMRDKIIEACETAGPGILVHPYRGELTVVCRGLSVRETAVDGGMCTISMTFLESGEAAYPSTKVDSVNAISKASNTLTESAEQGFVNKFVTTGFPSFVRDAASAQLTSIAEFLESPGFNLSGELDDASEFYASVRSLATEASDLVLEPVKMAQRVVGVVTTIRDGFGSFADFLPNLAALAGSIVGAVGANAYPVLKKLVAQTNDDYTSQTATPSRAQESANHTALNDLIRQVAIGEMAKEAVVTDFDSIQDAVNVREELTGLIDKESESTSDDDVFSALGALNSQVVRGVPRSGSELPRLIKYTPRVTLPSLLVAYQIYGDASRAEEITQRNKPKHPGFLPGGEPLEVLSDG